jgi:hypothetical protein
MISGDFRQRPTVGSVFLRDLDGESGPSAQALRGCRQLAQMQIDKSLRDPQTQKTACVEDNIVPPFFGSLAQICLALGLVARPMSE